MLKKTFTGLIALAVMTTLVFGTAFASTNDDKSDSLNSTSTSLASTKQPVSLTASKARIKVVVKYGSNRYSYNSNGLVSRHSSDIKVSSFKYNGKKLKSFTEKSKNSSTTTKANVVYDKSGRIDEVVYKGQSSSNSYTDYYYYNSKGLVSKIVCVGSVFLSGTDNYHYNKKKQLTKIEGKGLTATYKYDKKGYCNGQSYGPTSGYGFTRYFFMKNVFKNGLLIKVGSSTTGTGSSKYSYSKVSYKTIRVPKSYLSKVKQQQKAIFNPNPKVIL